nr:ribonuclease H-like domain-containing protein [Tanacetum cinerariifolium]
MHYRLSHLGQAPIPPSTTHETTQPNNTTIPNAEPNTLYGPTPQGPTFTEPSPSPQSTLPTSIARDHANGPSSSAHQSSPPPPPIFDFPNPQPHTEPVHEPPRTHPMITRSQSGIVKPIDCLSLHTSSISPIPKNSSHALKDPNWRNAMYDEYNALVKNSSWLLVPSPASIHMFRSMWLFKHKFHADGTLSRYKACLVANGSSQQQGVDFNERFSPVIKPTTIRTVLSLAVSHQWPIHQLDVKNAFLKDDLSKTIYMHQSPSFVDARQGSHVAYLLIYMDDIILIASYSTILQQIIDSLHNEFDMTDLGALNYFLGILRIAIPQQVFLYMHDPREPHFAVLKRILRYVRGTGLWSSAATTSLHTLSRSSAEAEYRGVANVVAKTAWLRNLLRELHSPLSTATLDYCDNVNAVYMSANHVQHQRTKHIEIDIHFVRDMVTAGQSHYPPPPTTSSNLPPIAIDSSPDANTFNPQLG